ncbi:MAG: phosphoribosylanthranilate isomerase [Vallitalea sp.]|jgi:phosphoribosylanthranilate isomerase|nr:phosphoribosylanthranilate isomerase [Vallitalea sp.]
MIPKIKICGIKNIQEINIINKYPVSYIGFIFAESKRQITEEKVVKLRKYIREDIKVVGVFVNADSKYVNRVADSCKLDIIQLHGNEDNDYIKEVNYNIWKSLSVINEDSIENIKSYKGVDGFLLDTYSKGKNGGTGKIFNWNLAKNLSMSNFTILAGGLNKENIIEGINTVKPQVIDINSGVETNLIKDENKIKELFNVLEHIK